MWRCLDTALNSMIFLEGCRIMRKTVTSHRVVQSILLLASALTCAWALTHTATAHAQGSAPPRPCDDASGDCTFDTRTHVTDNGVTYESITAYGQYWNFRTSDHALSSYGWLHDVPRYTAAYPQLGALGPCHGRSQSSPCRFDTRTHVTENGVTYESIIASHQYWLFRTSDHALVGHGWLVEVPRYSSYDPALPDLGPCQYGDTLVCRFDSRTHTTDSNGVTHESITAYGRYWNFRVSDGVMVNAGSLSSVPRYMVCSGQGCGPCHSQTMFCTFDTRTFVTDGNGVKYESITAYGRYWNYRVSDHALVSSGLLTDVARYASP